MAEETNDPTITTKRESVEVIDAAGNSLQSSSQPLAQIFDKLEQGKTIDDAVKEVQKPAEVPKEEKKEEKKEPVAPKQEETELSKRLQEKQEKKQEEEVSREALRKESEAKKEEEPAPSTENKDDDVPEDELKVLPHDKPKTAKRIQALLKKVDSINQEAAKTKQEVSEKATRLAELEKKLAEVKTVDPKTNEEVQKQLADLAMYRRRYDLDKDPEVKAKYDDRIVATEKPISEVLTKNGASGDLLKMISEEGGWLQFSKSARPVTLKDGVKPAYEVAELILQNLPFGDRKTVEALATEQITTKREKDRFLEEQQRTATEHFKKQDEAKQKQSEEYQRLVAQAQKQVEDWHKEVKTKNQWLQEKPVPDDATPEQKASIEDDNRYTKQLNGLLKKAIETKDIPGMLEIVFDSVQFYQERRAHSKTRNDLEATKKEVLRLQGEIDKFKNGARNVPRAGSIAAGGSNAPAKKAKPVGIEAAFDMIAAGGNPLEGDEE